MSFGDEALSEEEPVSSEDGTHRPGVQARSTAGR